MTRVCFLPRAEVSLSACLNHLKVSCSFLSRGYWMLILQTKWLVREIDRPLLSSAKVKNVWNCAPQCYLFSWYYVDLSKETTVRLPLFLFWHIKYHFLLIPVVTATCGADIINNMTYFVSPAFPALSRDAAVCSVKIQKVAFSISQLRLDFVHFNLVCSLMSA
jgi:hypothetical protein